MNKSLSLNFAVLSGIGISMLLLALLSVAPIQFLVPAAAQSTANVTTPSSNITGTLSLSIAVAINPITRGSPETLSFTTTDAQSHQAVAGAQITGTVRYPSGFTHAILGITDQSGAYSHTWTIGGHSNPGTFKVNADASATGFSKVSNTTSFEGTTKAG